MGSISVRSSTILAKQVSVHFPASTPHHDRHTWAELAQGHFGKTSPMTVVLVQDLFPSDTAAVAAANSSAGLAVLGTHQT
jgi:hypothetical protein